MIKQVLYSAALFLLTINAASAQGKLTGTRYAPDHCDFMAEFPEDPHITKQCENPDDESTCFDLVSYTKVFDLNATVRFELVCNPSTPELYEEFKPAVMENTVRAMTKETIIEAFELNTRETDNYKQTGLLGKARRGVDETLFIAQLWITEKSIMSVEAELIGLQRDDSDALFAQVLQSIGYKSEIEKAIEMRMKNENSAQDDKTATPQEP